MLLPRGRELQQKKILILEHFDIMVGSGWDSRSDSFFMYHHLFNFCSFCAVDQKTLKLLNGSLSKRSLGISLKNLSC
jgi:hypothetical protein